MLTLTKGAAAAILAVTVVISAGVSAGATYVATKATMTATVAVSCPPAPAGAPMPRGPLVVPGGGEKF